MTLASKHFAKAKGKGKVATPATSSVRPRKGATLAGQHFTRMLARKEAAAMAAAVAASSEPERMTGNMAERMLSVLNMQRAELKSIQSRQAKIARKREFLPDYDGYIAGVMDADSGVQDDVVTTVMLWRLDTGDYPGALKIADYAIRHDLAMPGYIARDVPTTLVEEIADAAIATPSGDLADALDQAFALTESSDMPDEVRAKGEKAIGLCLMESDPAAAISAMKAAIALDPKCGLKTKLKRLEKEASAAS